MPGIARKTVATLDWLGAVSLARATHPHAIQARQTTNTTEISWTTCPDVNSTQCGVLDVPMDYTNENNNRTVSIFLRKYSATAAAEHRLGSLLINPGGPAGSGSAFVADLGRWLSNMVDGTYDIIGFDPRAVNLTGPPTACHDTEAKFVHREYQIEMQGAPFPHVGGAGDKVRVAKLAAIQSSHNAACEQNGDHEMLQNSGTVAVAKDLEKIVQALGEDGLNFLGYSYGSIIGATFAAIRPNLVKRMVLDGISDAELYYHDVLQWGMGSVQDTQKTLTGFISTCIEAGPTQCALAITRDNQTESAQGLGKRLDALFTRLGQTPLVVGDSLAGPGIIQAHNVQFMLFAATYSPRYWSEVARYLALLEQDDGRDFYSTFFQRFYRSIPMPYTQNVFNRSMQLAATREAQYPALCGDSPQVNVPIDGYTEYFRNVGNLHSLAHPMALITGGCRGWTFRAKERYTGPWAVETGLNKTRFPILFVSTEADPATPLPSAVKMSRGFGLESASLLIQRGFGHTSPAHPSLCTAKHIRDYFVDGKVPQNGTYCTPEPGFIYPTNATKAKRSAMNKWEDELLSALESIGEVMARRTNGF